MEKFFKIGEISRLYNIGVDSLRYYEEIGLITPVRSESGYRLYCDRDIWKLNVIRDLRELGFGMDSIKNYLQAQSVETTLSLMKQEQKTISQKIQRLKALQENVNARIKTIKAAEKLPLGKIQLRQIPPRNCHWIPKGYSNSHEMDRLIKELLNKDRKNLYIIGSNQFGSVLSLTQLHHGQKPEYDSVFVIDSEGPRTIPGGTYLTYSYQGSYTQTEQAIETMSAYAQEHHLSLENHALELLWIDTHTTSDSSEFITELQILTL